MLPEGRKHSCKNYEIMKSNYPLLAGILNCIAVYVQYNYDSKVIFSET